MPAKNNFFYKRPVRKLVAVVVAAAVIGSAVYYIAARGKDIPEVRVSTLQSGDIASKMYVKAQIQPGAIVDYTAVQRQRVVKVHVRSGDQVAAGDVLLTLDQTELQKQYAAAQKARMDLERSIAAEDRAAKEQAAQSDKAQTKLSNLVTDLTSNLSKLIQLVAENPDLTGNTEYPGILADLQENITDLNASLPAILSGIGGGTTTGLAGGIDLSPALSAQLKQLGIDITDPLVQAKELEQSYKQMLDDSVATITATAPGMVAQVNTKEGAYVGTSSQQSTGSLESIIAGMVGESLTGSLGGSSSNAAPVVVYNNTIPKAVFKVSQFDSTRLDAGMKVAYTMNGKNYSGVITYKSRFVEDSSFDSSSTNDLLASAGIVGSLNTDPQLIIEMSIAGENLTDLVIGFLIDAEIETAAAGKVLILPAEAMRRELDEYYVFTVDAAGLLVKTPFVPGIQSDMFVEVASGLKAGDKVVLSPGTDLEAGMKVTLAGDN
ncbi:MAG: efflux RND transporter periplasmic adaptor subunit [Saccharofermentanales bacterium]